MTFLVIAAGPQVRDPCSRMLILAPFVTIQFVQIPVLTGRQSETVY
jgi:hypothetical protein